MNIDFVTSLDGRITESYETTVAIDATVVGSGQDCFAEATDIFRINGVPLDEFTFECPDDST